MKLKPVVLWVAMLIVVSGCRQKPESAKQIIYTQIDPVTAGSVSGTVDIAGPVPQRIKIDMSEDPVCAKIGVPNLAEQFVARKVASDKSGSRLANVFIYVTAGLGNRIYAAPTQPVVVDQKNCRYTPHVIGVMAGQPVEFHNSDETKHNVHALPTEMANYSPDITQGPMGAPERRIYQTSETMIEVRCVFHPWMSAFINVAANPFYAVSDAEGRFEIKGLPPGTYTLTALHEKLPAQTASVTVRSGQTTSMNFTFSAQ